MTSLTKKRWMATLLGLGILLYPLSRAWSTLSNQSTHTITALGNGSTSTFTIGFPFFDNNQIKVYLRDESSSPYVTTEVTQGSGATKFSITGGDPGTTVMMGTSKIPSTSQRVLINRVIPYTQTTDYNENDIFPAEDHEEQMDRQVMMIQQLAAQLDTKIGTSTLTSLTNLTIPDPVADSFLLYNHTGTALTLAPSTAPQANQVMKFNGTQWVNEDLSSLGLSVVLPTTTNGDLLVHNGTSNTRLGVGTTGQVLTADTTLTPSVKWATLPDSNTLLLYNAVLGSSAQVTSGLATQASWSTVLTAVTAGSTIYARAGIFPEQLIIDKEVNIQCAGRGTVISNGVVFTSAASYARLSNCKVGGNITIASGASAIFIDKVWLASGKTITDNNGSVVNLIEGIQE